MNSKVLSIISENTILKYIYGEAFKLKLIKRNIKAKPQRVAQKKEALDTLSSIKGVQKRIIFCGVPVHKNMGDQAQRYCIEKWCQENYPDYIVAAFPTWPFYERDFREAIKEEIKSEDIIIIQSGYCTTDRHYDHFMHRFLVKTFRNNQILFMPQTVNFFNESEGYKTGKLYAKHNKLLFLARDKVSFESAKRFFKGTKVVLYPDIVTTLIGSYESEQAKKGILLCVRNDTEKKYTNDEINKLANRFIKKGYDCEISDTNSDLPLKELV